MNGAVTLAALCAGKSYLVVYPALFAYLWFGANVLDAAVALSITLMGLVIAAGF